jgi:hypothetical protein
VKISLSVENVGKIADRLEALAERMSTLVGTDLPAEVQNWQIEDMHRQYPETATSGNSAGTTVWPTSRTALQMRTHSPGVKPLIRRRKRARPRTGAGRAGAARPILREELVERFNSRMLRLGQEKIRWD